MVRKLSGRRRNRIPEKGNLADPLPPLYMSPGRGRPGGAGRIRNGLLKKEEVNWAGPMKPNGAMKLKISFTVSLKAEDVSRLVAKAKELSYGYDRPTEKELLTRLFVHGQDALHWLEE
jgi:hypothetical protein